MEEESSGSGHCTSSPGSVIFEKPDLKIVQHIIPLYITGHLYGILGNRLLVDNGFATNLRPKFMIVSENSGLIERVDLEFCDGSGSFDACVREKWVYE